MENYTKSSTWYISGRWDFLTFPGPPANSEEGALLRGSHSKPCEEGDRELVKPTLKAKMEQLEFYPLIWAA